MADKPKNETRVVDFGHIRAQKLEEKRRKTERIFFKQILGIYTSAESGEYRSVELVDLSEEGLSFQIPYHVNETWPGKTTQMVLRMYFSQETYLPVHVEIINSRPCIEEGVRSIRYGCKVDQSMSSYQAYQQFVLFLRAYAEHSHQDNGSATTYYL